MKIALIGYGKMGRTIEEIALQKGHSTGLIIDIDSTRHFTKENLDRCDVAIEFTGPESAKSNIIRCLESGIPVVSGSTGWLKDWDEVVGCCNNKKGSFLYASNFSVGVNLFFALNKQLARMMSKLEEYEVQLDEIHHTQKKDSPSGTAITLAEQVMKEIPRKKNWVNHPSLNPSELTIISKRIDPDPGTHSVKYSSAIDDIEIIHTAHSRKGFAQGALMAAEYIRDKKGIFGISEVLGF